jgi:hypothetical protein
LNIQEIELKQIKNQSDFIKKGISEMARLGIVIARILAPQTRKKEVNVMSTTRSEPTVEMLPVSYTGTTILCSEVLAREKGQKIHEEHIVSTIPGYEGFFIVRVSDLSKFR